MSGSTTLWGTLSRRWNWSRTIGAYLDSLGWAYFRAGDLDKAEESLRRAVDRFSKDPTVHDHLGDVYFKQGNFKDAIVHWQMSLKEWENPRPQRTRHCGNRQGPEEA